MRSDAEASAMVLLPVERRTALSGAFCENFASVMLQTMSNERELQIFGSKLVTWRPRALILLQLRCSARIARFEEASPKQSALAAIIACSAQKKLVPSRMKRPSGSAYHCDMQPKGLSDGSWKRTGLATSAPRGCTAASAGGAGVVARDGSPAAAPPSVPLVVLIGDDLAATEGRLATGVVLCGTP